MRTLGVLAIVVASTACVVNGDRYPRPSDLEQSWLVSRTRILGMRAIPAEIAPGQRAEFEALIGAPAQEDPALLRLWLACADGDEGCATGELGDLDLENPDPAQLEALGFIGFELGAPGEPRPAYTAPVDLLDDLDEADRKEGRNVTVQLTAFPVALLDEPAAPIDFNVVEAGYKRLVVSEAPTPNNNPVLAAFAVDGITLAPDTGVVWIDPGQRYDLSVFLAERGGIETYEFVNREGQVEERIEAPFASWFASGGTVLQSITLWPFFESTWEAPSEEGATGTWYVVVRDRRGGMSWWLQDWVVGQP